MHREYLASWVCAGLLLTSLPTGAAAERRRDLQCRAEVSVLLPGEQWERSFIAAEFSVLQKELESGSVVEHAVSADQIPGAAFGGLLSYTIGLTPWYFDDSNVPTRSLGVSLAHVKENNTTGLFLNGMVVPLSTGRFSVFGYSNHDGVTKLSLTCNSSR